jgi:subtilisin family serine protease
MFDRHRFLPGLVRRPASLIVLGLALSFMLPVRADQGVFDLSNLLVPDGPLPVTFGARPARAEGRVQVVVQLKDPALVAVAGPKTHQRGARLSADQQRLHLRQCKQSQDALMAKVRGLGGRELARFSKALMGIAVSIDASQVEAIAALPEVRSVRRVKDYQLHLTETVPYIGAAAVQAGGFDGTGVRVAVLDSGVDYTHANFGGPGSVGAYFDAYGTSTADPRNKTLDGLFPTAKVVGGFDFVGEAWPSGALAPDPDPIDCGPSSIPTPCAGGHGTHVADIIAGNDGVSHKGVAPGASLYAVKVCSSISTSCSGIALLQGMDFALDPNGDGDISDAVDVINMSLGSSYGQREDDLSEASANAVRAGVVVVAAAGNAADRPYIVSSPSSTPEVISVAQTQVPSAELQLLRIVSPAAIAGDYQAVYQPWSTPLTSAIQAPIQYGNGSGGNLDGCAAFTAGSLAGKIVLVDRGTCSFSIKISNIAGGGGLSGLIGLVAPGEPFEGAFGGGTPTVPGFMIHQATSNTIKSQLAAGVVARLDPANTIPLVGSMVSGSARGPSYSISAIKPDIGAPGASVSAEAGTGTSGTSFGGTSGATPMVSGSVALVLQAHPGRTPAEIKSLLMNNAETNIQINPASQPGVLAPISRIGGGEVRVDRAFDSTTAAWDREDHTGSLSFGYHALNDGATFTKKVVVRNYGSSRRTYSINPEFRYASDAASGAVRVIAPSSISVPGNGSRHFTVRLKVDADKLPVWSLNGGSRGGDGFRLQDVEFDGYIKIADGIDDVHVAWQVLCHRAAAVKVAGHGDDDDHDDAVVKLKNGTGALTLSNRRGAVDGRLDAFSLTGNSPRIKRGLLPQPGDNFAIIDLKSVGVRQVGTNVQFAVNTFGERAHPNYPAEFDIYIDANRDGTPDSVIFNLENGGFAVTGQNVVAAGPLPAGPFSAFFFSDADLNSANAILTAPLAALGLSPGTQFDFSIFAFDNYFSGNLTDSIEGMTYTLATPRFVVSGVPASGVPAGGSSTLTISAVPGGDAASPSQTGVLLLYRDARPRKEADALKVRP